MKTKNDQGFSLIEVLVAIVILAAFVVPTCSALVLSARMNAKAQALMQAQLDVSSAVEILMARGIKVDSDNKIIGLETAKIDHLTEEDKAALSKYGTGLMQSNNEEVFSMHVFWIVKKPDAKDPTFTVTAISKDGLVEVTTSVRKAS